MVSPADEKQFIAGILIGRQKVQQRKRELWFATTSVDFVLTTRVHLIFNAHEEKLFERARQLVETIGRDVL
jgi:hypothetical protein